MPTERRQRGSVTDGRRRAKSKAAGFSESTMPFDDALADAINSADGCDVLRYDLTSLVIDALRSIGERLAGGDKRPAVRSVRVRVKDRKRSEETQALLLAWDRFRVGRSKSDAELIGGFAEQWKSAHPKSKLIPSIRRIHDYRRKFPVNGNIDLRGRRS